MAYGSGRQEGAQTDTDGGAAIERIVLATAEGANLTDLVELLGDALGASCCLVDGRGTVRAVSGTPPSPDEVGAMRALAAGDGGALLAWRRFPIPSVRRVEGQLLLRRDGPGFGTRERTILTATLPALALALGASRVPHAGDDGAHPAPAPVTDGHRASLLAAQDPATLAAFTGRLLQPLSAWDSRRGTDLVGTLRVFLAADGRWDQAAAELGVHVNTVRNRLARIEDLTGTDLGRLDDRVDFVLALEADALLAG